jgi:hypothetical protein
LKHLFEQKVTTFSFGIILNHAELIRSEGLHLVSTFIEKTINALDDKIKYICYDNASHVSEINKNLNDKTFVIDRFHLQNHKQSKCKITHNCETVV